METNQQAAAEGKLTSPPSGFDLLWVWHADAWHLARRDEHGSFTVFQPGPYGLSNIIEGPRAAEVKAAPALKPLYIGPPLVQGQPAAHVDCPCAICAYRRGEWRGEWNR